FPEHTTAPKEGSENALFDILLENNSGNLAYCQALINKIFELPYAQLPDFISYNCKSVNDPIKWLNKFEKLIAENEELFVTSDNRGRMIKSYTVIESKRKEIEYSTFKQTSGNPSFRHINSGCETRCFSFKETKCRTNKLQSYTEKIIFLTKE